MQQKKIKLENICKKYDEKLIFENLNIEIQKSTITAIMGPSGIGKTTILRMVVGLEKPDCGNISGIEKDIFSAVFQEDRLCENLTVESNIKLVLSRKNEVDIKAHLKEVGLENEMYNKVKNLSGGMKRRVAIVRAVVYGGDLFIMDEPFKGLDLETKQKCMDYILRYLPQKTLIISTHDQDEAKYLNANILNLNYNNRINIRDSNC